MRSRVVGWYEGVLLGKVRSPGVVAVDGGTPLVGYSGERRWSQGRRVVSSLADDRCGIRAARARRGVDAALPVTGCGGEGTRVLRQVARGGPDGVAPRVHEGVLPVSARGVSGPWGVSHAPHKGAAEGTEDFVHKGRVCHLGVPLSADGGLQLLAQRQRPDLGDCEDWAQVGRSRGLCRPLVLGDGLQLLPVVQVEPPCRRSFPGVRPAAPRPPPEAVEGMAWVPGADCPRHDGRYGVQGLAVEQGGGAVRQGRGGQEHGVDGLQAPVALLRVRADPHLVVVATFQHDHGDGAWVTFARRGRCACRYRVPPHHAREVTPPVAGCPAFPVRLAFVRWDAEGFGSRRWGGPLPAPAAGCGPGVCRWCYERVCPAQMWDPYASLVRLVGVEPPDPPVNKVVRDLCPGGDERLEVPHKDFGCCGVWEGDHGEEPARVDVLEVIPEGCH